MRDIVECPRPGCPNEHVMLNDNFEEGRCVQCQFHFCARCRSKFHGGDRCREGRIAKLTPDQGNFELSVLDTIPIKFDNLS